METTIFGVWGFRDVPSFGECCALGLQLCPAEEDSFVARRFAVFDLLSEAWWALVNSCYKNNHNSIVIILVLVRLRMLVGILVLILV